MRQLEQVRELARAFGGWANVLMQRTDFVKYVMHNMGCSERTANDYIDTIRGAAVFQAKMRDLEKQQTIEGEFVIAPGTVKDVNVQPP